MFRATILPIFRSFRLCNTAYGMLYPICCPRWSGKGGTPLPNHRPATYWVQHTTSCIVQSKAPEDGKNCCPKHVELKIGLSINIKVLLHLVGFLLYHRYIVGSPRHHAHIIHWPPLSPLVPPTLIASPFFPSSCQSSNAFKLNAGGTVFISMLGQARRNRRLPSFVRVCRAEC